MQRYKDKDSQWKRHLDDEIQRHWDRHKAIAKKGYEKTR